MAVPRSTYRLQITADHGLDEVADQVAYLVELGSDAVYFSPLLQAATGSDHGYDVVDPTRMDVSRGGESSWSAALAAARSHDLRVVVDIVPNHLGVEDASENPAWWDLLENGQDSRYARWFDVDWSTGRIKLPVLGDGAGDDDLEVVDGELRYYEHRFPLAPDTGTGTPAEVHARQHYELVNFRRADTEQNYRRFFAVTTLAGLRVEDPAVFDATHERIRRWVSENDIDGLRVDHPDGLAQPGDYLERLRALAGDGWIIVEKILEPGEFMPPWPVSGTTGYDALTEVAQVLVDPASEPELTELYRDLTGDQRDFEDHVEAGKRMVATGILAAETQRLVRLVPQVTQATDALTELAVAFPVYRSYMPLGAEHLAEAIETVHARRPDLDEAVATLTPRLTDPADELAVRFQQVTGAVMAKGVEDTAYYRYSRFVAANEVGGDPARLGVDVDTFHAAQVYRQESQARSMTTLSTHDTKRGEDVRARLAVLAELPAEWGDVARGLMQLAPVPNRSFGYLLWQTFAGVGYIEKDRMHAYAEKAMREAADGTGWIDPDETFEAAVHAAVDTAYDDPSARALLEPLLERITPFGWSNSLSQKLIQLTMPGVPDVYQGTELWEDSLVDPDNRRPVDYPARRTLLGSLGSPPVVDANGAAKLWVVSRALRLRRDSPDLFDRYEPVFSVGQAERHVVAFDRGGALTVATRLPVALAEQGGWGDTVLSLPADRTDVLTGRTFPTGLTALSDLLSTYPVALLA